MKTTLQAATDEYLYHRESQGISKATLRNDGYALRQLITIVGNIYVENVTARHVDTYFTSCAKTQGAATRRLYHGNLDRFFRWCASTGKSPRYHNPLEQRRAPKVEEKERRRLHVSQFPALLDATTHARNRMALSLGLYLFLRASEMASLRIRDVDLQAGTILVTVHKSRKQDLMPISRELSGELRRWLTYYTTEQGPLNPDWYLVPAKTPPILLGERRGEAKLKPTVSVRKLEQPVQEALVAIGWMTPSRPKHRTLTGISGEGEGIHTLRRSGARALFDVLVETGGTYDGAGRTVQAMLHHAWFATTEHYLGITVDKERRNALLTGETMFPNLTESNVVQLSHGREDRNASGM